MRSSELYSLEELKEAWPKESKRVLVVGAHRAGSSIATKVLADLFKIKPLMEDVVDFDKLHLFFDLNRNYKEYILQCPGLTFICHRLPVDLVIFMRRNYLDIVNSEKSIGWRDKWAQYEVSKYFQRLTSDPAVVKDRAWRFTQKKELDSKGVKHFDLWYESMSEHPLWINKEDRNK